MKQFDSIHKQFKHKDGSEHIASRYALKGIEAIIKDKNIKSVFEFGIGIGTIPYLVGSLNSRILYYGTEDNEFCLNAINENLPLPKLNIDFILLNNYEDFKEDIKFDLIIIDGKFDNIEFVKKIVHKNSIVFIEGDRADQQNFITTAFPLSLKSRKITTSKNQFESSSSKDYKNSYQGGYTIFRLNPNFINKLKWCKDKFETSVKYRLRSC